MPGQLPAMVSCVVVSSFFADIHKNNELNNFVLPVVVTEEFLQELFASIEADPKMEVEVNLPEQTITNKATGKSEHFEINAYKKLCLMNGLDDIDFLLSNKDKNRRMGKEGVKIEIMDTTLRDGEQTSGVSFVPHEKLMIARLLLEDLKVDRVEVASARVSDGEFEAVKMICDWAARRNLLHKVEVLGFVDGHTSVDWIQRTGCRVINLLCKGSLKHCTQQLKKTPEEHLADIINVVHYADEQDITVNVYLEDWSNGIKDSPEYVFQLMDGLRETSVKRYMLPDTLGILNPLQVIEYMRKMKKRYPNTHLDFHAHNDYDLAVSNVLAAVLSGVKGLHTTINGLGERAGNAPLASVQAILKDHFNAATNIDESRLNDVSRVVESIRVL